MVGLVIVSHSRALAQALVSLIEQVTPAEIAISIAAGVGEDRSVFGTDAVEIAEAIQQVDSPEGVLVLMDLGSAVLSAELSLELLPPEIAERVRFCAAPLVEGAIAAAVQAGLGSDLDLVCQEARSALVAKAEQLGQLEPEVAELAADFAAGSQPEAEIVLTINNEHGLHARPAARFVQTANSLDAEVFVRNLTTGKGPVSARSLNALARLGVTRGHEIAVVAQGPDRESVLAALERLVDDNFGEAESQPAIPQQTEPAMPAGDGEPGAGVPVSEGVALGPLESFKPPAPDVPTYTPASPEEEWRKLNAALGRTRAAIREQEKDVKIRLGPEEAAIFEAHALILDDPELHDRVRTQIYDEDLNAAQAWHSSVKEIAETYRSLDDPYLRQRALDVEDVGNQLLMALLEGGSLQPIRFERPVVLFAQDLTPTQTAQLESDKILGLLTLAGGPTSHSAILARALGIPAVSGVDPELATVPSGTTVGLDGFSGRVWVNPDSETQDQLHQARADWLRGREELLARSGAPARTLDGHTVEIAANVGSLADAAAAARNGAEAVGLLRTEFLFLTRSSAPDEEEQMEQLLEIGRLLPEKPLIVRTLDVGGDKDLPYLDQPPELNPFLGVRAIRLARKHRELLLIQLRAILRAAVHHPLRVMFPLISTLEELQFARQTLAQAHEDLERESVPHAWPLETGIMIETPAAALLSRTLAVEADFFSVGTNDLTQYTVAAERGNAALAAYQDALHPAVLSLIARVVAAAEERGIWVGVCGELAGDPVAVPVLVGLGVRELSLNPTGIPRVKDVIRRLDFSKTRSFAASMLELPSAEAVRQAAEKFSPETSP